MIGTGLDALLSRPGTLSGRRYALLAHAASVSADLEPAHLALGRAGAPPAALLAPEHGVYGVEQDMVGVAPGHDPLTGVPVRSLYDGTAASLRPSAAAFEGLDLLVVDVQDVGARYYTYLATAIGAAEVALASGCEVWVLDRPNPLGGARVEGNRLRPACRSFVGAFELPVRHGLTPGEVVRLEAARRGWDAGALRVWPLSGWRREMLWTETGRPWIAPSPNLPTPEAAAVYPGTCLVEATRLSEGRGTTRPFLLVGAPRLDPRGFAAALAGRLLPGVRFVPVFFRPQFHKHAGEVCGGVETVVTDPASFAPYRCGVEILAAARALDPEGFAWRSEPYEFVADRPAIDLLTGDERCRLALESEGGGGEALAEWVASWAGEERSFLEERRVALLYPEETRA